MPVPNFEAVGTVLFNFVCSILIFCVRLRAALVSRCGLILSVLSCLLVLIAISICMSLLISHKSSFTKFSLLACLSCGFALCIFFEKTFFLFYDFKPFSIFTI